MNQKFYNKIAPGIFKKALELPIPSRNPFARGFAGTFNSTLSPNAPVPFKLLERIGKPASFAGDKYIGRAKSSDLLQFNKLPNSESGHILNSSSIGTPSSVLQKIEQASGYGLPSLVAAAAVGGLGVLGGRKLLKLLQQQKIQKQLISKPTNVKNIANAGTLIGAGSGALVGAFAGDPEDRLRNALKGGLLGGFTGRIGGTLAPKAIDFNRLVQLKNLSRS